MALTITAVGSRCYVEGNTYAIKDALRRAGCHWDGQRKAWWIGSAKRNKIEHLISQPLKVSADVEAERLQRDRENILGTARYADHSYFVVGEGCNDQGAWVRLMFRDGSKTFFKAANEVQISKRFRRPVTLDWLTSERADSQGANYSLGCGCPCHKTDLTCSGCEHDECWN